MWQLPLRGHMVNVAWLALALLGWTPCLLLVSLLPSQVPGEAHRMGRDPGAAPVCLPLRAACTVSCLPLSEVNVPFHFQRESSRFPLFLCL